MSSLDFVEKWYRSVGDICCYTFYISFGFQYVKWL